MGWFKGGGVAIGGEAGGAKGVIEGQCCASAVAARVLGERKRGMNANVAGIQGGFSRVAGVVQYHFVLNLTCCAALPCCSILNVVSAKDCFATPCLYAQTPSVNDWKEVAVKGFQMKSK